MEQDKIEAAQAALAIADSAVAAQAADVLTYREDRRNRASHGGDRRLRVGGPVAAADFDPLDPHDRRLEGGLSHKKLIAYLAQIELDRLLALVDPVEAVEITDGAPVEQSP